MINKDSATLRRARLAALRRRSARGKGGRAAKTSGECVTNPDSVKDATGRSFRSSLTLPGLVSFFL